MKAKNLFTMLFAGTLALGLFSCKKTSDTSSNTEIETTYELSEDQAISDNLTEDSYDVMNEAAEGLGLSGSRERLISNNNLLCATVTVSPGGFPKTITIDFGTGCTAPGTNITRSGIIQVVISDSLRVPGSTSVMTFQNYFVNGFKKEGTITWTNTSTPGTRSWRREVVNGKITAPGGTRYWIHNGVKNVTQTAGVSTPRNLLDDEFSITGSGTTTNANNVSRSHTILTALVKKTVCENIVSGTIRFDGPNHTAVLDYGNGTCDRIATISIDGGTPRTILLRQ